MRYVGTNFYITSSTGKLSFLNNLVRVFEYEVDNAHNYHNKTAGVEIKNISIDHLTASYAETIMTTRVNNFLYIASC